MYTYTFSAPATYISLGKKYRESEKNRFLFIQLASYSFHTHRKKNCKCAYLLSIFSFPPHLHPLCPSFRHFALATSDILPVQQCGIFIRLFCISTLFCGGSCGTWRKDLIVAACGIFTRFCSKASQTGMSGWGCCLKIANVNIIV